ncbi:MAG: TauD/TfdA family dioxygenase [Methyloligellaceae bacterium]
MRTSRFVSRIGPGKKAPPLLSILQDHAIRPKLTRRYLWQMGSIAMWDNRCSQQFALNDYHRQRGEMHGVTVCGDRAI